MTRIEWNFADALQNLPNLSNLPIASLNLCNL
jgi:hypothetical protein